MDDARTSRFGAERTRTTAYPTDADGLEHWPTGSTERESNTSGESASATD